jgi:hypothetical protein
MKKFSCTHCQSRVFFENDKCLNCGNALGFVTDSMQMEAFNDAPDGLFTRVIAGPATKYRRCQNGTQHKVCNWMVPENEPDPFCVSCRLNDFIPDLTDPKNLERWHKLEMAKRRCIYSLLRMHLPMKSDAAKGGLALQFNFLADTPAKPVITGHADGKITVNILEADEDERERRRLQLHEPYRTLVGHFRHELGHFYWDCLIKDGPQLTTFRELFGDETADYDAAMKNYYQQGPAADWPQRTITAYASMHPWEDWAETWAQYFHIKDTLESFDSFGLKIIPAPTVNPQDDAFEVLCLRWVDISFALNAINRSMGLSDLYPFIINPPVRKKLRFIDQVVSQFSQK